MEQNCKSSYRLGEFAWEALTQPRSQSNANPWRHGQVGPWDPTSPNSPYGGHRHLGSGSDGSVRGGTTEACDTEGPLLLLSGFHRR